MPQNDTYKNLARKHRPLKFGDVVGQESVTATISNSLKLGRVAHAYLFYGPRGCGKTTAARILAKALNCTGNGAGAPVAEPCLKCPSCLEIATSSDMDVLEIDAASNTKVEQMHEMIIDNIKLAPTRDRYRIFILDEVHMLSNQSFNALLKTVEEPPPHVVFIMATTEKHKVPATIVSRCQTFRFRPITNEAMTGHLKNVAEKEGIKIDSGALDLIARSAGGAMRDGVTLLDRAVSCGGDSIDAALIAQMLGKMPEDMVREACRALIARDAAALHKVFDAVRAEGYDAAGFLSDLRNGLARLFYFSAGYAEAPFEAAAEIAGGTSSGALAVLIRRINRALDETRFSDMPLVQAEINLFTVLETPPDFDGLVKRLESLEGRIASGASAPRPALHPTVESVRPAAAAAREESLRATKPYSQPAPVPKPQATQPAPAPAAVCAALPADASDGVVWKKVLECLEKQSPMAFATLAGCHVDFSSPSRWKLSFESEFKRTMAEAKAPLLSRFAKEMSGRDITFSCVVGAAKAVRPAVEELSSSPASGGTELSDAEPLADSSGAVWQDINEDQATSNNAAVKRVLKILPGKVIKTVKNGKA